MGWSNIVDFIQSSRFGSLAGVNSERVVRMGEPAPLMPLSTPRDYHSFYVDNYDGFKVVAASEVGLYEGRPSDTQLKLREVFKVWGVGRDPKKAAEGTLEWSSLGAEQLGEHGLVGSARKFRRAVLGSGLRLLCSDPPEARGSQELLSFVGKAMHSVQFCRPLACLFDEIYLEMSAGPNECRIGLEAEDELLMIISSLPLHWMDQRLQIAPQVYATDASLEGGGACVSTGLSSRGRAKCHMLGSGDDLGGACDSVLVIEVFGGIGGLRRACELIGLQPQGLIYIDVDDLGTKLVRRQCGYVLTYGDLRKITFEDVKGWRRSFPKVSKVVLGAGWPCKPTQGASGSAGPSHDELFERMVQLRSWLEKASAAVKLAPWSLAEIYDALPMSDARIKEVTRKLDASPFFIEGAQVLRCRRPRLWWTRGVQVMTAGDLMLKAVPGKPVSMVFDTERPPLDWFLKPGCQKLDKPNEPFYSFARPEPKKSAPVMDGLGEMDQRSLGRWKGDAWRLAPFHYAEPNMVKGSSGIRRLTSDEQLRMFGYTSDHLSFKQKVSEDQKQQLLAVAWLPLVAARLLVNLVIPTNEAGSRDLVSELWRIWEGQEARSRQLQATSWSEKFGPQSRGQGSSGSLRSLGRPGFDLPVRLAMDPKQQLTDEQFLALLVGRNVSHRGTDVRLDCGLPFVASDFGRRSVDPTMWQWKVLLSYKWKQQGHITMLEAVAVLDLLKKLTRTAELSDKKAILMVDNQGVVGILAKGRSSARLLQGPLRRISALQIASHVRLLVVWVKSEWNPGDGPSRWVKRRAVGDA